MTTEVLNHVAIHQTLYRTWIDSVERVQIGSDYVQPLIEPFLKEFPTVNLYGNCHECILDMLVWALSEYKKSQEPKTKK